MIPSWVWFALAAVVATWLYWYARKAVRDIRAAGDAAVEDIRRVAAEPLALADAALKVLETAGELADAHRAYQRALVAGADIREVEFARVIAVKHLANAVDEWRAAKGDGQ